MLAKGVPLDQYLLGGIVSALCAKKGHIAVRQRQLVSPVHRATMPDRRALFHAQQLAKQANFRQEVLLSAPTVAKALSRLLELLHAAIVKRESTASCLQVLATTVKLGHTQELQQEAARSVLLGT